MAHDVFISHSGKDKTVADAVCATLEKGGTRCWIAPRDIVPGTQWGEAIIDAISNCKVMVLVFSSNANESQQIIREVERAVNKGIPVIPFRVEDVDPNKSLEYYISAPHWLDALTPPLEQHLGQLNETIKLLISKQSPSGVNNQHSDKSSAQSDINTIKPPDSAYTEKRGAGFSTKLIGVVAVVLIVAIIGFLAFSGDDGETPDYKETENNNDNERSNDNEKVVIPPPVDGQQWGALALTPVGGWGFSTNQPTQQAAEQEAMVKCSSQNSDCELKKSFYDCMVYARADDGTAAWGTHANIDTAREAAVSKCHEFTSQTCSSHVELCADGSVKRVNVWGAIATADNEEYGSAWNYPTRGAAEAAALKECQIEGTNCQLRTSFTNCAAVAKADDGALGWAKNDNMDNAVNAAYEECRERTSNECSLLVKVCADGGEGN